MTHTVAAKQRLYPILVKASVHIYKENKGKNSAVFKATCLLLEVLASTGRNQKVNLDN